eukprot:450031_1
MSDASKLKINDKIDHRDEVGRVVYSAVIDKKGTNIKIHYDKWSHKWDTWCDFSKELYRYAKPRSISKRLAHRFENIKKHDYVDINPIMHPGWKTGQIRRIDANSGQIQVAYQEKSLNEYYQSWAHVDNTNEIAKYASKSLQVQNTDNENSNNSKKRKLSSTVSCDMKPQLKKRKLSDNHNGIENKNESIDIYKQNMAVLEQKNGDLEQQIDDLKKRLNLLECKPETINRMSLDELNELKIETQKRMRLIEEAERQLMENTFKCIACMDNLKNISFDACDHIALCDKCEETLQSKLCPMCQVPYNNVKKVRF